MCVEVTSLKKCCLSGIYAFGDGEENILRRGVVLLER
jgi:hypothetical protein